MQADFSSPADRNFRSVFDKEFDVIVCGTGFIGFWAARALAEKGQNVLLVDASGDLLWEATRALENRFTAAREAALCAEWIEALQRRKGSDGKVFDIALAEIVTACALVRPDSRISTLLYAAPIAVEKSGNTLIGMTVATKGGLRSLRARNWVDATEQGVLTRLSGAATKDDLRVPAKQLRSLVIHSNAIGEMESLLKSVGHGGIAPEWIANPLRESERRLRWAATEAPWHQEVTGLLRAMREAAGERAPEFAVSHCALREYPLYSKGSTPALKDKAENLIVLSPSLRGEAITTLEERVALGLSAAAETLLAADTAIFTTSALTPAALPTPVRVEAAADILVAGTGTAGALAAIAAGRVAGGRTLAIDLANYPGGVGTGGIITGYFHGSAGGMQLEIDARTQEMTALLNGHSSSNSGWHHDAKKLSLLALFEEAGVRFLGDAFVCDVEKSADGGHVQAVLAVVDGELLRLEAKAFIDGTGDADLAACAGAAFVGGRSGDGRYLAYSQSALLLQQSRRGLHVRGCNYDAGWVDPIEPEDLSRARLHGIAQHLREDWTAADRPIALAPLLGLRQSRQIESDHNVSMDDMIVHARFEDWVGEVRTVADSHSVDFEFESDELMFYYWVCRVFKYALHCELPYRMLLPQNLTNVWVACRASGIDVDAAYGLRMQREMQRIGEASGVAAALSLPNAGDARSVDIVTLQQHLRRSGATPRARQNEEEREALESAHAATIATAHTSAIEDETEPGRVDKFADPIAALDKGLPDVFLWLLYRDRPRFEAQVRERLQSPCAHTSFYAATVLAMWGDATAEPRLLQAIEKMEIGPESVPSRAAGAYWQCIDLPHWLQAVGLLRCCGTAACLPALYDLSSRPGNLLNVRTLIALTLERLAERLGEKELLVRALDALLEDAIPDALLPPSRSLWRALQGEPQKPLPNDRGAKTDQDHSWQLHLVAARAHSAMGLPVHAGAAAFRNDVRGFVRQRFEEVIADQDIAEPSHADRHSVSL